MHVVTTEQNKPAYVRRNREDWIKIVEAWQNSALTQRDFCAQNEIALSSFYKWRQKLSAGPESASSERATGFVNVFSGSADVVGVDTSAWCIELDLGDISLRLSRR